MKLLVLLATLSLSSFAGGLYLEIAPGAAGQLVTARVTACHEPAKSVVTAHLVTLNDGKLHRQPIAVKPVSGQAGLFAVAGPLPQEHGILELAVTNPEFKNYEPKVLIRADAGKVQIASKKHFFSTGPALADYRQVLGD